MVNAVEAETNTDSHVLCCAPQRFYVLDGPKRMLGSQVIVGYVCRTDHTTDISDLVVRSKGPFDH